MQKVYKIKLYLLKSYIFLVDLNNKFALFKYNEIGALDTKRVFKIGMQLKLFKHTPYLYRLPI